MKADNSIKDNWDIRRTLNLLIQIKNHNVQIFDYVGTFIIQSHRNSLHHQELLLLLMLHHQVLLGIGLFIVSSVIIVVICIIQRCKWFLVKWLGVMVFKVITTNGPNTV